MAATFTDELKITDKYGFIHTLTIEHNPEIGISFAFERGLRLGRFEYGRWRLPTGDDDADWEQFEERFREGIGGEALTHFEYSCKEIINQQI